MPKRRLRRHRIVRKCGRVCFIAFRTTIDIALYRFGKRINIARILVRLHPPVVRIADLFDAMAYADVTGTQFPEAFVKSDKQKIGQRLRKAGIAFESIQRQPDMQEQQVQPPVQRIGHGEIAEERLRPRPLHDGGMKPHGQPLAGRGLPQCLQYRHHRSCLQPGLRDASTHRAGARPKSDTRSFMRIAALFMAGVLIAGCTPVINQRGYLPDPDNEAAIEVGKDTKTTVQSRLGYPSVQSTFNGSAWYYVSSVEKQVAFFTPTVQSREIFAVYFDKDSKVADLKHYGLEDGHVVAFESRTTPAKGRELTFLQQLFNATPGVPVGSTPDQNPGGGGGPGGGY